MNNNVIVITGGSSGIGEALAKAASRKGARVVLADVDAADWNLAVPALHALDTHDLGAVIAIDQFGVPADQHSVGSSINFMAQRTSATLGTALAITFVAQSAGSGGLHRSLVVGIVGMGEIGQALARRARAFGMTIAYSNRKPVAPHLEQELGASFMSLDEVLATSDVVSELRNLRDIIPICSHCRKLRTDVGDWRQLEEHFQMHSGTLFSHGICPDCLTEHYTHDLEEKK